MPLHRALGGHPRVVNRRPDRGIRAHQRKCVCRGRPSHRSPRRVHLQLRLLLRAYDGRRRRAQRRVPRLRHLHQLIAGPHARFGPSPCHKEGIGLGARTADNEALRNTLGRLYKPDPRYGGGTAGALGEEGRTGIRVLGGNHRASAEQNVNALEKILAGRQGPLSTRDRYTALRNQRDLQDAIRFFDSKRPDGYVR